MLTKNVILMVVFFSALLTVVVWAGLLYSGDVLPTQVNDQVISGQSGVNLGIINQLPEGAEWIDQDSFMLENGSIVLVVDYFPEYFQDEGVEDEA